MRIPRVYTECPLQAHSELTLPAGAGQHIARVLRRRAGDALLLFDGRGGEFSAAVTAVEGKEVTVAVGEHRPQERESALSIHLGIALSRGDRMDWVVQKTTELGVTDLTPLFTKRTEVKLDGERRGKKIRHWQQVAVSACEQCGRNRLPAIHSPRPLGDWLAATGAERRFVLHHRAASSAGAGAGEQPASVALLIGPEGGLSGAEILAAEQAGFQSLQLGPRVLRTETAPLAAIAILQARWGDMAPESLHQT
ncbi:MAG: 16S rRNA (uracil(1498)-N(3))-methyltransferase [Halioglobus sp.]|nr:16S rRNA (uracil(1498)-N(3))-methyltransferase [Halioglobus sp.]